MICLEKDIQSDPYADDLASLGLDILGAERHAPNPLLPVVRSIHQPKATQSAGSHHLRAAS
jgi:hypothetical protein